MASVAQNQERSPVLRFWPRFTLLEGFQYLREIIQNVTERVYLPDSMYTDATTNRCKANEL